MTSIISERVVRFVVSQEQGRFEFVTDRVRLAIADIKTGSIIEVDPNFPGGEMLKCELADGTRLSIYTKKIVQEALSRGAVKLTLVNKSRVKKNYQNLLENFIQNTNFTF